MIPALAVEAAAKALWQTNQHDDAWVDEYPEYMDYLRAEATKALEVAAPYMVDKRGDGDYLPGWDDRKTLAGIWQEHAMLPVEGLSDGVYSALIAVATWGYQQRKDEDL